MQYFLRHLEVALSGLRLSARKEFEDVMTLIPSFVGGGIIYLCGFLLNEQHAMLFGLLWFFSALVVHIMDILFVSYEKVN